MIHTARPPLGRNLTESASPSASATNGSEIKPGNELVIGCAVFYSTGCLSDQPLSLDADGIGNVGEGTWIGLVLTLE